MSWHEAPRKICFRNFFKNIYIVLNLSIKVFFKIKFCFIIFEEVCDLLPEIFDIIDTNELRCSFFERMVALAFSHFEKKNVDWAVIETGLG